MKNSVAIEGIKKLLTWMENNPELEIGEGSFTIYTYGDGVKEKLATYARSFGHAEKDYSGEFFFIRKAFGPAIVGLMTDRSAVCTKRVTGTKHVEAFFQPAHEEEIVEWDCDGSLLKESPLGSVTDSGDSLGTGEMEDSPGTLPERNTIDSTSSGESSLETPLNGIVSPPSDA